VFINDILQVPGKGYEFNGGSQITFTEAPKGPSPDVMYEGDTMKFLFYKGTGGGDVIDVDVIETVKKGDDVRLEYDSRVNAGLLGIQEDSRTVTQVTSTNSIDSNIYFGPGLSPDGSLLDLSLGQDNLKIGILMVRLLERIVNYMMLIYSHMHI